MQIKTEIRLFRFTRNMIEIYVSVNSTLKLISYTHKDYYSKLILNMFFDEQINKGYLEQR